MRRLLVLPLLLLVLVPIIVAACSGGKGSSNATPTTSAGAIDIPTNTPGPSPTPVPDPFASLQNYRYQMDLLAEGSMSIKIVGVVKASDTIRMDFYMPDSDAAVSSLVIIGDKAWAQAQGDETWQSMDVAEAENELMGLLPKDFWGTFPTDQLVALSKDQGQDNVNGIPTEHYQISEVDAATMQKLSEIFGAADAEQPSSFAMDLWRAIDGWPAKADIKFEYPPSAGLSSGEIKWEMKDVNAVADNIQPPA